MYMFRYTFFLADTNYFIVIAPKSLFRSFMVFIRQMILQV